MNMQTCTKSNPRETEGTKTLLFINIRSYNEEVMVHIYRKIKQISLPFFRSCCLDTLKKSRGHLPLVTSGYYQPRWQVTHFQFLSGFQDGGHVKFPTQRLNVKIPTQGEALSVNFPWEPSDRISAKR